MATHPAPDGPEVVGQIIAIPVEKIDVGERLRPIDANWAEALGRIIRIEGQRTPIEVCRLPGKSRWTLVAGAHRLAGASLENLGTINAIVVSASAIDRKLREVSENLWRKGLDPVDRATFVAEMHQLLRTRAGIENEKDGRAISAHVRWQKAIRRDATDATVTMTVAYGFSDQIADRIGLSVSAIERDLMLHRRLAASAIMQIGRDHPVSRNATQLRALARLDYGEQVSVAGLLREGKARSVSEAIAILRQKRRPDPEDKRLSAFIGAFGRMSLAEKKGALAQLAGILTPALRAEFAGALSAEGGGGLPDDADAALREARMVLAMLLDGAFEVTNGMLESAHDKCEAAIVAVPVIRASIL